jgi:outer membrane beta-barrel protein
VDRQAPALTAPDREPVYSDDPFGDADLADAPLIMNVAHPRARRFDMTFAFATSLVDKYVQQPGASLDLRYHFAEHWGIGGTFSFFGGSLTDIVTDGAGVLGNKVTACRTVNAPTCDLSLRVPDTKQMTGSVDLTAIWLPFYGKVNLVSELDFDMQLYLLAGGGVNGTRLITAEFDPSSQTGYVLSGGGAGEGGMFANAVAHVTLGAGVTVFLNSWLALRGEYRAIIWRQSLDNDGDGVFTPGTSWRNIAMVGLVMSP